MKTDTEIALFLLDRWVTLVLLCFIEPIDQYYFVLFANVCDMFRKQVPTGMLHLCHVPVSLNYLPTNIQFTFYFAKTCCCCDVSSNRRRVVSIALCS